MSKHTIRGSESFRTNRAPVGRWSEIPAPPRLVTRLLNEANSYLRCYRLGPCTVIVTKEGGRWHMSISHPQRYPTWDEIASARYKAIPDEAWMVMVLPPKSEYVNVNPNCMQLKETDDLSLMADL